MKQGMLLAVVSVLAMALGCDSPTTVRHQRPYTVSPEFSRDRNAQWRELARPQQAPSMEKVTYLGAQVVPAPEALRAQLSLPEGTGLMVTGVAPHSPAANASLARFDVLTRFNDQCLINPEQLAVLVRDAKTGQEVRLTVIRHARLATVRVKLASHNAFEGPMGRGMPAHPMPGAPMGPGWGQGMREDREGNEGAVRIEIREGKEGQSNVVVNPEGRKGPANRPGPAGQERREGYKGEMIFQHQEDGTLIQVFRDNEYALRLVTDRNGNKTLTARNIKDPKVVFEGPIDTPVQRAKLPVPVRRRLEQIEKTPKFTPPAKRGN